jgi:rRNA processing protein Gar1
MKMINKGTHNIITRIRQLSDHINDKNNKNVGEIIPVFVGPISKATSSSNPPKDLQY